MPDFVDIEGLAEARAAERLSRFSSFLPVGGVVCGLTVPHFTIRHWAFLAGNPFLVGGSVSVGDALAALWVLTAPNPLDNAARGMWLGEIARREDNFHEELFSDLTKYFDEVFFDARRDVSSDIQPGGDADPCMTAADWLLYTFTQPPYNWLLTTILDAPVKLLYQMRKTATAAQGKAIFNPLSDTIRREFIRNLNAPKMTNE